MPLIRNTGVSRVGSLTFEKCLRLRSGTPPDYRASRAVCSVCPANWVLCRHALQYLDRHRSAPSKSSPPIKWEPFSVDTCVLCRNEICMLIAPAALLFTPHYIAQTTITHLRKADMQCLGGVQNVCTQTQIGSPFRNLTDTRTAYLNFPGLIGWHRGLHAHNLMCTSYLHAKFLPVTRATQISIHLLQVFIFWRTPLLFAWRVTRFALRSSVRTNESCCSAQRLFKLNRYLHALNLNGTPYVRVCRYEIEAESKHNE